MSPPSSAGNLSPGTPSGSPTAVNPGIDPRGGRFAAAITTVVLAIVLITGWWPLLAAQAIVFAIGAFHGFTYAPYAVVYRRLVAPRLGPPEVREPEGPPRFAQGVGFAFAVVGTVAFAAGFDVAGMVATALALFAAFLNAAFGICLGCRVHPLAIRFAPRAGRAQA